MRGIEQDRPAPCLGLENFERRIELVADFTHEEKAIGVAVLVSVGSDRALTPLYTVYCSWLGHKAKPCFWFTSFFTGHKS